MMAQTATVKPVLKDIVSHIDTTERTLITIEFAPNIHRDETEHTYEHPKFVFGDRVTIINTYPELEFTVCALELIESKTQSGKLLSQPRWKYKVSNGQVSYWKDETALIRYEEKTCSTCPHFNNYHEVSGRGWCCQFNHPARTYHIKTAECGHTQALALKARERVTNDCINNGALDKNNEALTTEVIELDRDGYPMEEVEPTGYFSPNFTTSPDEPF